MRSRGRTTERGFSLIEVIIAMTILSIVLGGAAMAVVSADNVEIKSKAVADGHAMAEKAVERLRTDLSARAGCDNNGWIATARAKKTLAPTAAAANSQTVFAPCLVTYNDMRDSKGREYRISLVVEAKDRPDDGYGQRDTDGDLRDVYDVSATVDLNSNSRAGRENQQPIQVGASVDWEGGKTDSATIELVACAIDRPDRALMAGGCVGNTASRQPISTTASLTLVRDDGSTSAAGTISTGAAPGAVAPGAYRISVGNVGGFSLLKVDPSNLRVYGSQKYTIQATYVRNAVPVEICTQVGNWENNPTDDGYETTRTNIHWRRTNQPGRRSIQVTLGRTANPRQWACNWVLTDPIENSPNLYRGVYDIEVEQNILGTYDPRLPYTYGFNANVNANPNRYSMYVRDATTNCSLPAWNQPMNGTAFASRPVDTVNDRPDVADPNNTNKASYYGRLPITAGVTRLCLRFWSKGIERIRCYQNGGSGPYRWTVDHRYTLPGCFYVGTFCTLDLPAGTQDNDNNCWNGADVCVSCGGGAVQGTAGPVHAQRQSGGVSGGPNDPTVACNTKTTYSWPGSWHSDWGISANIGAGTRNQFDWIGGDSYYRSNFSGRTAARGGHPYGVHPDYNTYNLPDNPQYVCEMSYFTAGSALFAGNGGPYRFYECLEVSVPGRPYKVRGRLLDISGSGTTFFGTVGTALALAPDASRMQNFWNPYGNGGSGYPDVTGGGNWPDYNVARVTGDPNCGAPTIHIDPIIWELWETVWDEPRYGSPPARTGTNLTQDRVGV